MSEDAWLVYEAMGASYEEHASGGLYNAFFDRPAVMSLVGDVGGKRVLDARCGAGYYAQRSSNVGPMSSRSTRAGDGRAYETSLWDEFNTETTYTPYPGSPFAAAMLTDHIALVAEDPGQPVGCVYANTATDHYGFVFGLYVRPLWRRRGIARDLMRAIADALRLEEKQYVVLSVDTRNEAARSLYSELGFVDAARTLRAEIDQLLG